jgi:hypothetical protein
VPVADVGRRRYSEPAVQAGAEVGKDVANVMLSRAISPGPIPSPRITAIVKVGFTRVLLNAGAGSHS